MKKQLVKPISLLLVLLLLISSVPMFALAVEPDDHDHSLHSDDCCQSSSRAVVGCVHIYQSIETGRFQPYNDLYHLSATIRVSTCVSCGFKMEEIVNGPTLQKHAKDNTGHYCIYCEHVFN